MHNKLLKHVERTLAVSNKRPAAEITDALLSWDRSMEHFGDLENQLGGVKGKKLLEIGSGFGLFLTIALTKGAKAFGLEPSKNKSYTLTSDISRELLRNAGFSGSLVKSGFGEKLPYRDNTFDIVCSFYTLEHVRNVELVMKEAVRVLKPGGHIFFEVPNYGSFWEGHYGIPWIPYLTKSIAGFYVKLWGKDKKLLRELQFVSSVGIRRTARKLPIKIVDVGKDRFREKALGLDFIAVGTLGSAKKILELLKKARLLTIAVYVANLFEAQTPIIFVAKKNVK